ncbi:hypothetical protein [Pendulispora albinea]|uniref:Uncharacterized protein n=1 Tax=Pendulispora albinea TaxID=2741071 RepID=A0ABZ2M2C9_9BACT
MSQSQLAGNGVDLVRERALARSVQRALERLYQIDEGPDVHAFVQPAMEGERESLLLRQGEDGVLEMALHLPAFVRAPAKDGGDAGSELGLDALCQLIEGVSHFVYVAERARLDREATQLELEVQAEVDKYVVLLASTGDPNVARSGALRARLYEQVHFRHVEGSEPGERYRVANDTAAKLARRLEREFIAPRRIAKMRDELRLFYRMGQEDKLRYARMT